MKYIIYDVCEDPSNSIYATELGKELTLNRFLELLELEIKSYCECYYYPKNPKETKKMIELQFIQNMKEVLEGKPIQINGMEFVVEDE